MPKIALLMRRDVMRYKAWSKNQDEECTIVKIDWFNEYYHVEFKNGNTMYDSFTEFVLMELLP